MGAPTRHRVYQKNYEQEALDHRNYLLLLGFSVKTCQAKYLHLKEFFSWLEQIGIYQLEHITSLEINHFYEYIQHRKSLQTQERLKQKTVCDLMRCVQVFLSQCVVLGKLDSSPASHLKFSYVGEDVARKILTQSDIKELYEVTENEQEKAMLHLGYGAGLRVHEISLLNPQDLQLSENLVVVQKGKNSQRRLVPLSSKICQELVLFAESQSIKSEKSPLFTNQKGRRMQPWTFNSMLKKWFYELSLVGN